MLSFQEFIQEDFNSNGATQFELTFKEPGSPKTQVFFESIPAKPFNLNRYMKSFGTAAKEIMKNTSAFGWRGIIFHKLGKLLVFVWSSNYLHHDVCKALDNHKEPHPSHRYLKSYNNIYMLNYDEAVGDDWCFPFMYQTSLDSNLGKFAIDELKKQKEIDKLFML